MELDLDSMNERTRLYQVAMERRRTVRAQIGTDRDRYMSDDEREALDEFLAAVDDEFKRAHAAMLDTAFGVTPDRTLLTRTYYIRVCPECGEQETSYGEHEPPTSYCLNHEGDPDRTDRPAHIRVPVHVVA